MLSASHQAARSTATNPPYVRWQLAPPPLCTGLIMSAQKSGIVAGFRDATIPASLFMSRASSAALLRPSLADRESRFMLRTSSASEKKMAGTSGKCACTRPTRPERGDEACTERGAEAEAETETASDKQIQTDIGRRDKYIK